MLKYFALTVLSEDRPGIVKLLSDTIARHSGNWLESSMSRLGGQFAGIILVGVQNEHCKELIHAIKALSEQGLDISIHSSEQSTTTQASLHIEIEANDRPGIIEEITNVLADNHVNVEQLTSSCSDGSMIGYPVFNASIEARLPNTMSQDELQNALEVLSDDLMVDIHLEVHEEANPIN